MTGLATLFTRGDFLTGSADFCFLAGALDGVTGAMDGVTFEVLDFISLFVGDQKNRVVWGECTTSTTFIG